MRHIQASEPQGPQGGGGGFQQLCTDLSPWGPQAVSLKTFFRTGGRTMTYWKRITPTSSGEWAGPEGRGLWSRCLCLSPCSLCSLSPALHHRCPAVCVSSSCAEPLRLGAEHRRRGQAEWHADWVPSPKRPCGPAEPLGCSGVAGFQLVSMAALGTLDTAPQIRCAFEDGMVRASPGHTVLWGTALQYE